MSPRNWARSPTSFEKKLPSLQAKLEPGSTQETAVPDARLPAPSRGSEPRADTGPRSIVRESANVGSDLSPAMECDQDLRHRPEPSRSGEGTGRMDRGGPRNGTRL